MDAVFPAFALEPVLRQRNVFPAVLEPLPAIALALNGGHDSGDLGFARIELSPLRPCRLDAFLPRVDRHPGIERSARGARLSLFFSSLLFSSIQLKGRFREILGSSIH